MKIGKLKEGYIYEIIWIDNNVMEKIGWVDLEELREYAKDNTNAFIRSVGILHAEDKIFVTLIGDEDLGKDHATMRVIKILKACICYIHGRKPKKITD